MSEEIVDATRRFVVGQGSVRGEWVRLDETWRAVLARRQYPAPIASLLGECLAAAALFTSTLKLLQADGRLTMQIQGGHPITLLVAECRRDLSIRGMARWGRDADLTATAGLADLARGATLALTIDPGGDYDAYQSFVPLEGDSVAETLNAYMRRSEQVDTFFALAAGARTCAGILVQQIPEAGGKAAEDPDPDLWTRVRALTSSVSREELLNLPDTALLFRLFHQEEVRLMPARPVTFVCRCSKGRVAGVLRVLGRDEVSGLLADRRTIDVDCDFCGRKFEFSAEEAWAALERV